jgi:ABC-2 type transport system permease protein
MTAGSIAFHEPGLWTSVWRLLRLRLVIQVNGFLRAKRGKKIGYLFAAFGILCLLGFILFLSVSFLNLLRSPDLLRYIGDTAPFLEGIPTMLVSVAAIGILFTSFGVLLQALYLSGDMDFLMSAPLPIRAVFISKLVQALLPNFGIMCLFTLPILFGLGISGHYYFLYYPVVVLVLVLISLTAAALASLMVMVAARFVPARRLAEVLGFVVGTFFFVFSQSARFMNFDVNDQQMTSMLKMTGRFNQPWSPLAWTGRGLVALGKSDWVHAAGFLAATLLVTGLVFTVSLWVSERLYYTGWSNLQNNRRRPKAKIAARSAEVRREKPQNPFTRWVPPSIRAILVKDTLVYRRDLRNTSKLITPLILGVVYAISMLSSGGRGFEGQGEAPAWFMDTLSSLMVFGDVALALFLGWMLVANLAGVSFSQEGKSYWMLKAAPVSTRQLLTAKFVIGYLPPLLLCSIYLLVLEMLKKAALFSTVVSLLAVWMILAGLTGIYLAFGVRGAKFDWENPSQAYGAVGCLGNLVGTLFLAVCFGLFILPPLVAALLGLPAEAGQLVGLFLGGLASAGAVLIPLGLVEKRVASLNEG